MLVLISLKYKMALPFSLYKNENLFFVYMYISRTHKVFAVFLIKIRNNHDITYYLFVLLIDWSF